jgi:hypothetical protein
MAIFIRKESSSRPSSQWRSCCQAQFGSDSQLQLAGAGNAAAAAAAAAAGDAAAAAAAAAAGDAAAAAAAAAGAVCDPVLKVVLSSARRMAMLLPAAGSVLLLVLLLPTLLLQLLVSMLLWLLLLLLLLLMVALLSLSKQLLLLLMVPLILLAMVLVQFGPQIRSLGFPSSRCLMIITRLKYVAGINSSQRGGSSIKKASHFIGSSSTMSISSRPSAGNVKGLITLHNPVTAATMGRRA